MIKKIFLLAFFAVIAHLGFAQGVLQVSDVSNPNDVYPNDDQKGVVIVKCNGSIPLSFESTMDKAATPYNVELEGSDSVYYIEFPTGSKFRGRTLMIMAPGYNKAEYSIELQPKQAITLHVIDPNSMVDAGCYRGHRNKGMEEIKNLNYAEAKNQFMVATECSDVDSVENNANIHLVDSILQYKELADQAYKIFDYKTAYTNYDHMMSLNPYDTYASNRYSSCLAKFQQECESVFKQAEYYFEEEMYDKAQTLYGRVIKNQCQYEVQATEKLNEIEHMKILKKNHARVLTYEYNKNTPIGLSYGSYNDKKVGGFIALDINNKIFEMMRNNSSLPSMPEVNLSFGWTKKIISPVWIFFGPGVSAKMYYGNYKVKDGAEKFYPGTDGLPADHRNMTDTAKVNVAWAISPVIGICAKYSYFSIRLSYQYKFAMDPKLQDFMGRQRFTIGIGVAF